MLQTRKEVDAVMQNVHTLKNQLALVQKSLQEQMSSSEEVKNSGIYLLVNYLKFMQEIYNFSK